MDTNSKKNRKQNGQNGFETTEKIKKNFKKQNIVFVQQEFIYAVFDFASFFFVKRQQTTFARTYKHSIKWMHATN